MVFEKEKQCQISNGDCLEIMKDIPDDSVDMVLTDPPYGTTHCPWDCVIDWTVMWQQIRRVLKKNGAALIFTQLPMAIDVILANRKNYRYEWIWQKKMATGFLNAHRMPMRIHENILCFYEKLPTYNPQMRGGYKPTKDVIKQGSNTSIYGKFHSTSWDGSTGERYPIDIITYNACTGFSSEPKLHPTQKPQPLLEYLIKTYTNENEVVLDCFMGSGSTGVACLNTNRRFVGIEKDNEIFDIADKRIADYLNEKSNSE